MADDTGKAPRLDDPDERLKWARERAGLDNATAAAHKFGWNENTYRSHENGTRGFKKKTADKYARAFKVPVAWLLVGEGALTPPIDPELITLWANITPEQQKFVRQLLRQMVAA